MHNHSSPLSWASAGTLIAAFAADLSAHGVLTILSCIAAVVSIVCAVINTTLRVLAERRARAELLEAQAVGELTRDHRPIKFRIADGPESLN